MDRLDILICGRFSIIDERIVIKNTYLISGGVMVCSFPSPRGAPPVPQSSPVPSPVPQSSPPVPQSSVVAPQLEFCCVTKG